MSRLVMPTRPRRQVKLRGRPVLLLEELDDVGRAAVIAGITDGNELDGTERSLVVILEGEEDRGLAAQPLEIHVML